MANRNLATVIKSISETVSMWHLPPLNAIEVTVTNLCASRVDDTCHALASACCLSQCCTGLCCKCGVCAGDCDLRLAHQHVSAYVHPVFARSRTV